MHGGDSNVMEVNEDTGYVHVVLSGACSGCGISPMTVQAMQRRMYQEIDFVENVDVDTGMDSLSSQEPSVQLPNNENEDKNTDSNINAPF
jgi:Fe-S cluster biogenesis protein NfuA